jgi:N-acetyl-1-D-myo-inositol-2-amino-2-deoxy-alpha-D-glucopyranoside deacetylase
VTATATAGDQSRDDDLPFQRTLVFAPHPDDESIGAGGLLAYVAARDAEIRVVFLTSGENNPWPQRATRRRWKITESDRQEWGRTRRGEARHALVELGVAPQNATFLGFPDDGLARIDQRELVDSVGAIITEFRPTLMVIPSLDDLHPDHRAAYRAIMKALVVVSVRPMLTLTYVVHGSLKSSDRRAIATTDEERARKALAIQRHGTQLMLSRRRLLRYAAREEQFSVVRDFECRSESRTATLIAKLRHVLSLL